MNFGEQLRKEREKRNISLDDVSLSTKIGTRMLRALEEEKFDQLPGGIFNKGFVRAYARYLGIDEDQAVSDYLEAAGEAQPPTQPSKAQPPRVASFEPAVSDHDENRSSFPWGTIAALILAVAIGLTIWKHNTQDSQPVPVPPPSVSQSQPEAISPPPTQPPSAAQPNSTKSAPSQATGTPSAASPSRAPSETTTTPNAQPPSSTATSAAEPEAVAPGSFAVLINADDDSWMSITADGRLLFQGLMVAPTQRQFHAQNQITIRAGNVGALNFSFNGKRLPIQGDTGEVKTLTFGPNGLQPPVPKPPSQ